MHTKMHLPAVVPNEGARRLAVWLLAQPLGTYDRFAKHVGGVILADRLLAGEVTPGRAQGFSIYSFTGRSVPIVDWYQPAQGSWFDAMPQPQAKRAA